MRYSNYCGNNAVAFIYYNEWADPKIEYKGFQWSEWTIDEPMREAYHAENIQETEAGYIAFVNTHIEEYLKDCLCNLGPFDIEFIEENAPGWMEILRDNIYYSDEWKRHREPTDAEVKKYFKDFSFVVEDFVSLYD